MWTVGLLGIPPCKALMQSMLPHEQARNGTHSRQTEYRPEDIGQSIHVGFLGARHPAIVGQIFDLLEVITQPGNNRGSSLFSSKFFP